MEQMRLEHCGSDLYTAAAAAAAACLFVEDLIVD